MNSIRRWQMMTSCRMFTPSCSSRGFPATSMRRSSGSRLSGSNSLAAEMRLPEASSACKLAISSQGPSRDSKLFFARFKVFNAGSVRTPPRPGSEFSETLSVWRSGMSRMPLRQSRCLFPERSSFSRRLWPRKSVHVSMQFRAKFACFSAGMCNFGRALSLLSLRSKNRRWRRVEAPQSLMDSILFEARLSFRTYPSLVRGETSSMRFFERLISRRCSYSSKRAMRPILFPTQSS
mmetsp:Transcript_136889/g.425275  ORF Transcript_136889/g.425275 Transcript_136889/m.425275 type:complete len:235 (-) Transcript_136889:226-930(-)